MTSPPIPKPFLTVAKTTDLCYNLTNVEWSQAIGLPLIQDVENISWYLWRIQPWIIQFLIIFILAIRWQYWPCHGHSLHFSKSPNDPPFYLGLPELLLLSVSHSVVSDFCEPTDCGPPGSSLHGILHARILEWVATSFSRGIFPTQGLNPGLCIVGRFFTVWATKAPQRNFFFLILELGGSVVVVRLSCPESCETLVPWPGIKSMSRALEGRFSTTGPPGKSPH